ncbi:hypothetical protein FTV88_2927 [Heliorestis convoluta]|uniref:Uncharacterized protein n=1 Tax=Heliorestis convoluta TaxID=356322 RepID=A0A5Q2N5W2_9FIRM|nr:hypothetical protein FTV88_2927 [Heliorestis convoluta]
MALILFHYSSIHQSRSQCAVKAMKKEKQWQGFYALATAFLNNGI